LIEQLRACGQHHLAATRIPDGLTHRFDRGEAADATDRSRVLKTTRRHIVRLDLARFEAVEVVRTPGVDAPADGTFQGWHSPQLQMLVPKGGTYGYDLIVYVGKETFLKGRQLQSVAAELEPLGIPFSSLHDVQQKFLFHLGLLHRHAAPRLRENFQRRGGATWLIDATIEPGTPMYFGIREAHDGIMLGAWRIATENVDELVGPLAEATQQFGLPAKVLHDLGDAMAAACDRTWGQAVPHFVCHFHLLRNIGEDLYEQPQAALRQLVRKLKLQPRLKEQRRGQTGWLREHVENPTALAELLRGGSRDVCSQVLGREVLLAFHQWILDYPSDGRRQGFPFDPYLLYFHRRVVRASTAVQRLLSEPSVRSRAPRVLIHFSQMLNDYLAHPKVVAAAEEFEQACDLFTRLRTVLRLTAQGENPLYAPYAVESVEGQQMRKSLEGFREECRTHFRQATHAGSRTRYQIVVEHLDRYWNALFSEPALGCSERTTNGLEGEWGARKRACRRRHGRGKLTRDFQCLPAEYMLVGNLENRRYVELVLGDLSQLPAKIAEASCTAEPWTKWRQRQKPLSTGRLPGRLLRQQDLIDKLVVTYDNHCQREAA